MMMNPEIYICVYMTLEACMRLTYTKLSHWSNQFWMLMASVHLHCIYCVVLKVVVLYQKWA